MSKAKNYIEIMSLKCEFIIWRNTNVEHRCNKPVTAVYVTADQLQKGRFICSDCATMAELEADGPVFHLRDNDSISMPQIYRDLPNTENNRYRLREFVDMLLSKEASEFDSGNVWATLEVILDKGISPEYLKEVIDLITSTKGV